MQEGEAVEFAAQMRSYWNLWVLFALAASLERTIALTMCLACGRKLLESKLRPCSTVSRTRLRSAPLGDAGDAKQKTVDIPEADFAMEVINEDPDATTDVLVGMIQWYKDWISPLIGPNCRYLPTCSSYAIASLKAYGPAKGLILTAWRILRCNPFGGRGYDPPRWPPPGWLSGN